MSLSKLTPEKITQLQKNDIFCNNIINHMHCKLTWKLLHICHGHLTQKVTDFNSTFSPVVVPKIVIKYLLYTSHDSLGHVGATKLYHFIKRLYYFSGMQKIIHKYIRTCQKCQIMNLQKPNYTNLHQEIANTPQDYILIDLMGPYNTTSQGNAYALTAICSLTGYLMTTLIPDKKTSTVALHLFLEILLTFGFPRILHSENGTEFKSKLIEHLAQQIGIKKTYISPCHPRVMKN